MTNEEYGQAFQNLKDNLFQNYVVYRERVTLLLQLTTFDIQPERVDFRAKIIKPLNQAHAEKNRLYQSMMGKDVIKFGAQYLWDSDDSSPLLENSTLSRAYCPFILCFDPVLTKFVAESEDDITRQFGADILMNEDWRQYLPQV